MFGIYRLALAIAVAWSHIANPFEELHIGGLAVVGFYALSGYLMTAVYLEKFAGNQRSRWKFWVDRWLRIFPVYLVFVVLSLAVVTWVESKTVVLNPKGVAAHLSILPLNYYPFVDVSVIEETDLPVIPPTWSLATELHFYLLVPFVVANPILVMLGLVGSFGLFVRVALSSPDPFTYAYTLPWPIFFTFFAGSLLYYWRVGKVRWVGWSLVSFWWLMVGLVGVLVYRSRLVAGFNIETISGLMLAMPVIALLSKYSPRVKVDRFLGALAYPLFLDHFLVLAFFRSEAVPDKFMVVRILMVGIVVAYFADILVEKPVSRFRYWLRKNKRS